MKSQSQQPNFWQNARSPIIVAHRGGDGSGRDKENSLKAFQAAYDLGYRWFETDVVPTKDGVLFAIHGRGYQLKPNKDLPKRLAIQQMTSQEAKQKLIIGGEPPLTLDELLDAFPNVKVFIDPKTWKSVPATVETLSRRPQDLHRICVGSFSIRRTEAVRKGLEKSTGHTICTAPLGMMSCWLIYQASRWPSLRHLAAKYIRSIEAKSLHVPYKWALDTGRGRRFVSYAHDLDLLVTVYTPNDESSIKSCLNAGVDAIMSDNVKLLKKLTKRKYHNDKG